MTAVVGTGLTMRVASRSLYNFSGLGASGQAGLYIAQHIDVSVFQEVDIIVRVHGGTNLSTGQSIFVGVVVDGYDFSDPSPVSTAGAPSSFLGPNINAESFGTVTINSSSAVPGIQTSGVNSANSNNPFGRLLAVQLIANQNNAGETLIAMLSVDLVLKGGDPLALPRMPNGYRGYRYM